MTPFQCLQAKVKAGIVRSDLAQPLLETIRRLEKEQEGLIDSRAAARQAAAETADAALQDAARNADLKVRQVEAQLTVLREIDRATEIYGGRRAEGKAPVSLSRLLVGGDTELPPLYHILAAKLGRDRLELMPGAKSVFYQAEMIRGRAHALMRETIEKLRPEKFGFARRTVTEIEALDAIMDPAAPVSAEARAAAKGFVEASELLRQEFNAKGGNIPKRENWAPNPIHDTMKIRTATEDAWVTFVKPLLNRDQMLDWSTGRPLTPGRLDTLLRDVYRTIATDGAKDGPSAAATGQGALARRHAERRVLQFRDAAAWASYDERFGAGKGVFEAWMDHIESLSHDIAMIEVLGPNPKVMQRYMKSLIDQWALAKVTQVDGEKGGKAAFKENEGRVRDARVAKARLDSLFAEMDGSNRIPVDFGFAHKASQVRDWLTASRLGSALLSSFTDTGSAIMRLNLNGLPAGQFVGQVASAMADRNFEFTAAQMGFVADSAAMLIRQNDRYGGETIRSGIVSKVANAVIAASGLRRWTEVHRKVFGMQAMAAAANWRGRAFDELPEGFRAMLDRHGISARDWQTLRGITPGKYGALRGEFITGNEIRALGTPEAESLAQRWQGAVNKEMDFAVLDYDPETRSLLIGDSKPGTLAGELRRSMVQFKTFPANQTMALFSTIGARGGDSGRLAWGAQAFLMMTMFGALSMQAKQIAAGRDPITMDPTDPKGARAWGAAILQGGGLGIFGDFLFMDHTRQGNNLAATAMGPTFAAADKVFGHVIGANIARALKGQETHFAGDALYAGAGLLPGSNLWYLRAAFERAVVDQVALAIDDRAPKRMQRLTEEANKNWGQSFWWEPGAPAAQRAPDLSKALGVR